MPALLRKIFDVPKPRMNRSGPAASCTTRASIATCTGCRVNGEMIPQPIVRRLVSRAIKAETTVEERASMPCLRHHGYASANQIVSMPASSIARAAASISSSGSIVSCITPMRNGTVIGTSRRFRERVLDLLIERTEHVLHLLVHDWLEHALAHRADGACDLHLGRPQHLRARAGVAELELRDHVHHRPDTLALDVHRGVLEVALLGLVHVDLHLQAAEAERDLHVRRPAPLVVHVEALDAGHRRRHRRGVVQHLPDRRARRVERALSLDDHASTTCTRSRVLSGCSSISQTRWYGL